MHFSVFDSRPSALFFSTSILSNRTSRPGVYQLIAHCSWVPLWANEIFFSSVNEWCMSSVRFPWWRRVITHSLSSSQIFGVCGNLLWHQWSSVYRDMWCFNNSKKYHVDWHIYHCPSLPCVEGWPTEYRDHSINKSYFYPLLKSPSGVSEN